MEKEILETMIERANAARNNAYAPYSKFPVGACLRTTDGTLYVGCNSENSSFSMTICSESAAVASMFVGGHRKIADLVVVAENVPECPPCGACRQRIYEFSTPETKIYLCTKEGVLRKIINIETLCTEPFNASHIEDSM